MYKYLFVVLLVAGYGVASNFVLSERAVVKSQLAASQLEENNATQELKQMAVVDNTVYSLGWLVVGVISFLIFIGDIRMLFKMSLLALIMVLPGCYRPFEPVVLEVVDPNEEAFLLPYLGDAKQQSSSNNEEYLKANLVFTKQVKIPQQWVPKGYEYAGADGVWQPAAILVKVDKSPVTREWTADPNSGTSNKSEAIWVMTADQVEFSTGWTITARIENRDAAVKFLHNYPNGSLIKVLDAEVRAKLQTAFALEVTDLSMDKLRLEATPHITKVVTEVTTFFKERGISVTNLGISGGFIYKDKTIMDTMVKVFNAEQEKNVASAESAAQEERNKTVIFAATGKADALLKTKKAEADGIKMVADAKMYELEKAAAQLEPYLALKRIELQKDLLQKWDGAYPKYFMGDSHLLLELPKLEETKK